MRHQVQVVGQADASIDGAVGTVGRDAAAEEGLASLDTSGRIFRTAEQENGDPVRVYSVSREALKKSVMDTKRQQMQDRLEGKSSSMMEIGDLQYDLKVHPPTPGTTPAILGYAVDVVFDVSFDTHFDAHFDTHPNTTSYSYIDTHSDTHFDTHIDTHFDTHFDSQIPGLPRIPKWVSRKGWGGGP